MKFNKDNCVFVVESEQSVSLSEGYLNMPFSEVGKSYPCVSAIVFLVKKEINRLLSTAEKLQVRVEPIIRLSSVAEFQKFTVYIVLVANDLVGCLPGIEEVEVSSVIEAKKIDETLQDKFAKAMGYIYVLVNKYKNTEEVMFVLGNRPNTDASIYIDDEDVLRITNELRKIKVSEGQVSLPQIADNNKMVLPVNDNNTAFKDPDNCKKEMYIYALEIRTPDKICEVMEVDKQGRRLEKSKRFDLKYPEVNRLLMLNMTATETVMRAEVDYVCKYDAGALKMHSYSLTKIIEIIEPEFQLIG